LIEAMRLDPPNASLVLDVSVLPLTFDVVRRLGQDLARTAQNGALNVRPGFMLP
jgi:hypothetical protein